MKKSEDIVTLGADVGGKDAFVATNPHILTLRAILRKECRLKYSDVIKEFALVLRIDGSVQSWGRCGVENVAFQKKKTFVTADIFVPVDMWSTGDEFKFRRFLIGQLKQATRLIDEEAVRQGVEMDIDRFIADIDIVAKEYLA